MIYRLKNCIHWTKEKNDRFRYWDDETEKTWDNKLQQWKDTPQFMINGYIQRPATQEEINSLKQRNLF